MSRLELKIHHPHVFDSSSISMFCCFVIVSTLDSLFGSRVSILASFTIVECPVGANPANCGKKKVDESDQSQHNR